MIEALRSEFNHREALHRGVPVPVVYCLTRMLPYYGYMARYWWLTVIEEYHVEI